MVGIINSVLNGIYYFAWLQKAAVDCILRSELGKVHSKLNLENVSKNKFSLMIAQC